MMARAGRRHGRVRALVHADGVDVPISVAEGARVLPDPQGALLGLRLAGQVRARVAAAVLAPRVAGPVAAKGGGDDLWLSA